MANPIQNPMTNKLDESIRHAEHLRGHKEYGAAIALARLLAGQIDDVSQTQDPDALNRLNMRVLPNFHKVLFTLGLTPEGFAKMTNPMSAPPADPEDQEPEEPKASEPEDEGDALDALIRDMDNVTKLGDHR